MLGMMGLVCQRATLHKAFFLNPSSALSCVSVQGPVISPHCAEETCGTELSPSIQLGFFTCVGPQSGPARGEDGGRAAGSGPAAVATFAAVVTSLLDRLQGVEDGRAEIYRELESVLWHDESHLQNSVVDRVIAVAFEDLQAAQGVTAAVRTDASGVLVALARSHLHDVMSVLQGHLKALEGMSEEFVLITLRNLAARYALQCVPFVETTLSALHGVLSEVGSSRLLRTVCGVVEQWCRGINTYFREWEKCAFPRLGAAQLCAPVYPLFRYVGRNWRRCEEEEVKQAVLRAMGAMMGVLLHAEQHRERAWEQLLWLLHQYREVREPFGVTTSLSYFLGAVADVQTLVPRAKLLAINAAVHQQLCDKIEPPSPEHRAELCRCAVLQAQICPAETIVFLYCKLRSGSKADRVAAVEVLQALVRSDAAEMREKLPLFVKLVQSVRGDPAAQVRKAVLHFIGELLRSSAPGCSAWDVVGHIFSEFSRASGRLAMGSLCAVEAREERAVQRLCGHVLGTLDMSARGVAKLLWPRLLRYVVPAQYTGMLVPLCRCLRALAERQESAGREEEEAAPEALESEELGGEQKVLACCARLGVSGAAHIPVVPWRPHAGGPGQCRAEQCPSLAPLPAPQALLARLLFLRTSLEVVGSEAWTVGLSRELSQQLGSSPRLSWEKRFLYKALGTALAACGCLRHVQEQTLRYLQEANYLELWQAQGMISVVSRCAESHFQLALSSVKAFMGTLKHQKQSNTVRTRATRAALMVVYGRMALRAPREQLLAHIERDIVGNVLQLYREGRQDAQLRLSLVQSVTEISLAIGAVGACPRFELCRKRELLQTLLEVIQEEPQESPVHPRAIVAIEQLSKLKPHLRREEKHNLLAQCCQGVVRLRRPEQMAKEGETGAAAPHTSGVHALSLRVLGQLVAALLRAEPAPVCFKDLVQVLRRWLTSAHACERERALQVCVQLLGTYEERREHRRGHACEQFGSLAGLLGPLTCDVSAVSRQRAATCLGRLLQIGAKTTDEAAWSNEIRRLCQRLNAVTSESLLTTSTNIAKLVCKSCPAAQATDFTSAIVESLLCARPMGVWAAGRWMLTFLGERGEQIFQEEVPQMVTILSSCLRSTRQSTPRGFALRAMFLLARSHQQPVLDSLLQKRLPMDSDMVELWRSLGRSTLGCHILVCLTKKLRAAGKSSHQRDCCTQELGSSQAALEPRTITRALSEVLVVLRSKTLVQHLLPSLLPSLLGQVSETLGEEMALSLGELGSNDTPGSLFVETLELVLARCLEERWLRLLREQGVWASLADPQAHTAGVCLLASVLIRAELVPQRLVQSLFPWLGSPSANLRLTATAFFAELVKDHLVEKTKLLKPLLKALLERSRDPINTVRQMAMRGVGNMASGAPTKLRRHRAAVVEVLCRGLEDVAGAEVAAESLLALVKVLGQLKASAVGSALADIARSTRAFLGAEEEVLRRLAFTLYGTLASSASGRRSSFSREVEEVFPSLVLHLRDPAPAVSDACKGALHLCAPFLGSKRVRRRIATSAGLSAAELQDEICSHLAQDCPALLERLFSTARSCCMGSCQASQVTAVTVLGIILDTAPAEWLQRWDLAFLWGATTGASVCVRGTKNEKPRDTTTEEDVFLGHNAAKSNPAQRGGAG
ncbi:maestro heat-like repeat-containing protein family member 2B [Struthio camelus]|uniref:maestro heat-like repeat-containing protein family member 2B n=1 Tax=Struthio camelus TaxID=8801 RepID=UPI0036040E79